MVFFFFCGRGRECVVWKGEGVFRRFFIWCFVLFFFIRGEGFRLWLVFLCWYWLGWCCLKFVWFCYVFVLLYGGLCSLFCFCNLCMNGMWCGWCMVLVLVVFWLCGWFCLVRLGGWVVIGNICLFCCGGCVVGWFCVGWWGLVWGICVVCWFLLWFVLLGLVGCWWGCC